MPSTFAAASVLFILIGLGFFITQNFNYGVDFTGGTLLIDFSQPVEVAEVNELLKEQDLEELSIITAGKRIRDHPKDDDTA